MKLNKKLNKKNITMIMCGRHAGKMQNFYFSLCLDLNEENEQLKEQLAIREKALELACGFEEDIFKCPNICEIGDNSHCYNCRYKYFIDRAKESIKCQKIEKK